MKKFIKKFVTYLAIFLFLASSPVYAATVFHVFQGGTGVSTITGIIKGNGTGAFSPATGGTDYEFPLTFSAPLSRSVNAISCVTANTSTSGCLSSTDWNTFNGKQGTISLTTTGTSGVSTFSGGTLNIPNYTTSLTGYLQNNVGITGGTTLIGGTAVTDALHLQSTSGVGTTDYISFLVGNNGGTEAIKIVDSGLVGIGTTTPGIINGTTAAGNGISLVNSSGISTNIIDGSTGSQFLFNDRSRSANSRAFRLFSSGGVFTISPRSDDLNSGATSIQFSRDGHTTFPTAPVATANYGNVSIGSGAFDGSTSGKFVGSSSGTSLAVNEVSGYAGSLLDLQVAGVRKFQIATGGIMNSGATQTTYNGSVAGTAVWSMPFQGTSYKKFIIYYNALHDAGGTITFPTAFSQTPYCYGDTAATGISSATTTTFTIAVAATITGNEFCEGY